MPQTFSTSTIGRGAFWSVINQSLAQVLALGVFLITARFVSQEAFGIMAICLLVVEAFRQIAIESVGISITSRKESGDAVYNAGFIIIAASGAVSALLIFLLAEPIATLLRHDGIASGLRWISLILLTTGLSRTHEAWLVKHLKFKVLAIRSMLAICIGGGIGIVMAVNGFGLISLIMQQLITAIISTITLWVTTAWRPSLKTSWKEVFSILRYSRHVSLNAVATFISLQGDVFFSSYYLGAAQTGIYNAAKRINLALWMMLSSALNSVALPIQASLQGDNEGSLTAFKQCVFMTACLTAPIYFGVSVLSPDIIHLLLGDKWNAVAPVLSLLAITGFLGSVAQFNVNIVLVYNKPHWQTYLTVIHAIANMILFFFIARYGLVALAGGYLVKTIIFAPLSAAPALFLLKMRWKDYLALFIMPLFSASLMGVLIYVLSAFLDEWSPYARLALLIPLGAFAYVAAMLVIDRKAMLGLWRLFLSVVRNEKTFPDQPGLPQKKLEVVFVLTQSPGAMCGVYDYTVKLADSLRQQGVPAHIESMPKWSLGNFFKILKKYRRNPVRIHLQYPTLGMSNSMIPGLAPLLTRHPVFVTLHEFTVFNTLRKAIFLPHALFARAIILTNDFEREQFEKFFPCAKNKTTIVPIGNNIPVVAAQDRPRREKIIYFGQISDNKGIAFFVSAIRILRQSGQPFDAAFIGSMLDADSKIAHFVRQAGEDLQIDLILNLPPAEVSARLGQSTIALLPFPDGITEKRGSALACLAHGNTVVTLHSGRSADWLRDTTFDAASPETAATLIAALMEGRGTRHPHPEKLAQQMASREWDNIARRHIALYSA